MAKTINLQEKMRDELGLAIDRVAGAQMVVCAAQARLEDADPTDVNLVARCESALERAVSAQRDAGQRLLAELNAYALKNPGVFAHIADQY